MKKGEKMSDEIKKRISISRMGKCLGNKHTLGFKHSEKTKKLMSLKSKGHKRMVGIKQSEEWKKHRGILKKDKWNHNWVGGMVTYRPLHLWVEKHLGKPHFCEHCGKRDLPHRCYHWANKSKKYKRVLSDWIRLCAKCHKKYDKK